MVTSAQSEHKNASEAVSDSNDNEMVQSNGEQQHTFVSSSVEQERERREQRKSDEDEENLPIRHVVIDDEDDESSERGVSEPPNETYHTSGLPYGDHNYGEISARSANSSRSTDEGSEHFPVIAGLASYFGDNENEQQQQPPNGLLQRNTAVTSAAAVTADPSPISYRASIRDAYYRNGDQGGGSGNAYSMQSYNSLPSTTSYRITPNPTANFVTIGGRTYVRQMTQNIPQGYRSGPRESYSSGSVSGPSSNATATYTGPRRMSVGGLTQLKRTTVRPSALSVGNHPSVRIGVFSNAGSPTKQQQQQQYNTTTTTSVVGNQSAANIVADPMRIANDNAPAPFIVPARGNKPSFRGKAQHVRGRPRPDSHEDVLDSPMNVYKVSSPRKLSTASYASAALAQRQRQQSSPQRSHQPQFSGNQPKGDYIMVGAPVEPARIPQPHSADLRYNSEMGNSSASQMNLPTSSLDECSAPQRSVASAILLHNNEGVVRGGARRAESPVTCIVESAHQEAIRRASESVIYSSSSSSPTLDGHRTDDASYQPSKEGDESGSNRTISQASASADGIITTPKTVLSCNDRKSVAHELSSSLTHQQQNTPCLQEDMNTAQTQTLITARGHNYIAGGGADTRSHLKSSNAQQQTSSYFAQQQQTWTDETTGNNHLVDDKQQRSMHHHEQQSAVVLSYHNRLYDANGRLQDGVEILDEGRLHLNQTSAVSGGAVAVEKGQPQPHHHHRHQQQQSQGEQGGTAEEMDRYVEEFLRQHQKSMQPNAAAASASLLSSTSDDQQHYADEMNVKQIICDSNSEMITWMDEGDNGGQDVNKKQTIQAVTNTAASAAINSSNCARSAAPTTSTPMHVRPQQKQSSIVQEPSSYDYGVPSFEAVPSSNARRSLPSRGRGGARTSRIRSSQSANYAGGGGSGLPIATAGAAAHQQQQVKTMHSSQSPIRSAKPHSQSPYRASGPRLSSTPSGAVTAAAHRQIPTSPGHVAGVFSSSAQHTPAAVLSPPRIRLHSRNTTGVIQQQLSNDEFIKQQQQISSQHLIPTQPPPISMPHSDMLVNDAKTSNQNETNSNSNILLTQPQQYQSSSDQSQLSSPEQQQQHHHQQQHVNAMPPQNIVAEQQDHAMMSAATTPNIHYLAALAQQSAAAASQMQLQGGVPMDTLNYAQQQQQAHNTNAPNNTRMIEIPPAHLSHLQAAAYINEELSSGDELLLAQTAEHLQRGQFNAPTRQPLLMGRSSTSAAEEENSFTEDLTEEKGTEEECGGDRRRVENNAYSSSQSDADDSTNGEEDSWGEDYTTRCLCGLDHNDEFMIQCDVCKVWQHCKCMGMDRKHIPKVYKCEVCNPRPLKMTRTEARDMQLKALAKLRKEKERRKTRTAKHKDERSGSKKRQLTTKTDNKKKKSAIMKKQQQQHQQQQQQQLNEQHFQQTNTYEYSRAVMAFARRHEDTCDAPKVDAIKGNDGLAVMFVTQIVRGLVSLRSFDIYEPVVYVCGRVSLPSECPGREKPGAVLPFVILYSDLYLDGESTPTNLCIDMRKMGSVARFARRSCHPNVKLQHFFCGGKLHIIASATEKVERGDEITLPFDNDFALSNEKLVCACCAQREEDEALLYPTPSEDSYVCPITMHNHELAQREQLVAPIQTEPPKKVLSKKGTSAATAKLTNKMSQKKKANAKKIGMSFAKMLHKKALRRAQKAKGMHKTDGRGRPRTVGVKRRGAGTSNAVGRPRNTPAISAGTGVADTSVTSDSQTKLEMDKFEQNEKNVEQSKPVVELTASTSASVVAGGAASNTDEESGPATRRSITSRTTPIGVEKKSTAAKSNHSSVTKKTSSQKRKATIKLKRRTTKSTSALRIVGTESGSTSAINDEGAVGDRSGDVVVTPDGEPNEETVLSDSESSRRKSTRSSTLATSSPAGSQLNASIKDEEDESANLTIPTSKIADSAETVQQVKIEGDNSKEEEKASSNEERRMTRGRLQKELEGKEQNERRELSVDPKQIVEIKAEPKDASKELPSEQNPQKETVADRNVADVKTEPADQVETTKKVGGRGKRKSVIVKSDGDNNDEEESKKKRESTKLHARRASSSQQSMAAAAHEMNYMLPEDRNKAVSREERKLQQQIALMERLQAQAKRKENKKHHANEQSSHHHHQHQDNISTTNVTDGGASTVEIQDDETKSNTSGGNKRASRASVRRSSMNATAAAESKKARVSGGASSNNKRSSLSRESDDARLQESGMGDVKKEAKEEPMESECNAAAAAVPTTAAKTTNVSSAVPTSTVHTPISPPPRKRWASALAKNETQSSHIDNATPKSGSNVVQQQPPATSTQAKNASTPSPVSGKKAWLLQRAKQTHEESTKMESETPSISRTAGVSAKTSASPSKKRKTTNEVDVEKSKISHVDAAVLLTQMAGDSSRLDTNLTNPSSSETSNEAQRPVVSPSGDGFDIRAQIGKIAAADIASGAKEFTLVGFLSNDHFAVLPSTSKMSAPEQSGATASVVAKTVPTSNPVGRPPKKKMSLDEYRKRKTTSCDKSEDNHHQSNSTVATTTASEQVSSSSTAAVTSKSVSSSTSTTPHSFIPTVNAAEVTRRTSLRLGALPDPSQLRALPTVSLDDLKERIYGKRVSAAASSSSSNAAASSSQASVTSLSPLPSVPTSSSAVGGSSFQSKTPFTRRFNAPTTITATPQTPPDSSSGIDMNQDGRVSTSSSSTVTAQRRSPPPPPPPPSSGLPSPRKTITLEAREDRLSLEERMRLVFGCGDITAGAVASAAAAGGRGSSSDDSALQPPPPPPIDSSSEHHRGHRRSSLPPITNTSNIPHHPSPITSSHAMPLRAGTGGRTPPLPPPPVTTTTAASTLSSITAPITRTRR